LGAGVTRVSLDTLNPLDSLWSLWTLRALRPFGSGCTIGAVSASWAGPISRDERLECCDEVSTRYGH
jgi:hypothetical protein